MSAVAVARLPRVHAWRVGIWQVAPRLASTAGTSAIIALLGLAGGAVAARELGPASRGELAQLLLWPQLFCTLGNLGVDLASTYVSADPARRRNVPATVQRIALAQSAVLAPMYAVAMWFVFGADGYGDALVMAALIPLYLAGTYSAGCLMGYLRFGAVNAIRLSIGVLYCAGIVALAFGDALTARTGAITFLVVHGAVDIAALITVCRINGFGRYERGLARGVLSYGVRAHGGRLSPQALGVDTLIIALLLSSHDLGLFVAATAVLTAPRLLASSMSMIVFPQVSAAHQSGERHNLHAAFALYAAGSLAACALLWVLAEPAVILAFGNEFAGAATVIRLLCIATVAISIRQFPLDVLRGTGRPGLTTMAEACNWLCFLVAVPVGAHLNGLTGAAAGVAVAGFVSLGVVCSLAIRAGLARGATAAAEPLEATA